MSFWSAFELWRDPLAADIVSAVACAALGVFLVLRKLSFVAATVPQAAGVGVTLALLLAGLLGIEADHHAHASPLWLDPTLWGFVAATLTGVPLGLRRPRPELPSDAIIAVAYVGSQAAIVLLAAKLGQEMNHVQAVLLGSAVAVEPRVLYMVLGVALVTLVTLGAVGRRLVYSSFDREVAIVSGLPVRALDVVLLGLVGLAASTFTRAVGALPVFAMLVLPPTAALLVRRGLAATFAIALSVAAIGTFVGFWASWKVDQGVRLFGLSLQIPAPTGATIVVTLGFFALAAALSRRLAAAAYRLWYAGRRREGA